jgi:hypothetical protein
MATRTLRQLVLVFTSVVAAAAQERPWSIDPKPALLLGDAMSHRLRDR